MAHIWLSYTANIGAMGSLGPSAAAYVPIISHPVRVVLARLWPAILANVRWPLLGLATAACLYLLPPSGTVAPLMMLAILLASLLSSIAGFAFSAICGAMLFHISSDPVQVVQVMITCSIANQTTMTWAVRRDIQWATLRICLTGGVLGLPFGVWLLLHAERAYYTFCLGAFLLAYGVFMLFRRPIMLRNTPVIIDFAMSLVGGVTGGAAGFPSGFLAIWCGMKGWDKARQRGLCQPFILIMQIAALALISVSHPGAHSGGVRVGFDLANLLYIPAGLLGTTIGLGLYRRLSDVQFARGVNLLLTASGLSFVLA